MKNCRRKLRGVVRGSLLSDSEFDNRLSRLDSKPDGKGMPNPFEPDYEKDDMGEVTEDDMEYAYKVMNWFAGEEKEFMEQLIDDKNWSHEGETESGEWYEHDWVKPENAPTDVSAKPGGCGCGCSGKSSCGTDIPKSIEDSLTALQEKVGRTINSRNAQKISQAIDLLTDVIGGSAPAAIQQKGWDTYISADTEDLFDLRESIDPVLEYYGLEAEVDDSGILIKELGAEDAFVALESIVSNFDEIQTKGIGRGIGRGARGGRNAGRFIPNDGDGDGFFSPAPGAPDKTPVSKLPKRGVPDKPRVYDGNGVLNRIRQDQENQKPEVRSRRVQDFLDSANSGRSPKRTRSGGFPNGMSRLQRERERERERYPETRKLIEGASAARRAEEAGKPGAPVRKRSVDRIPTNADGDAEIEKEIADYDEAAKKRRLTTPQRNRKRALEKERDRRAENKRRKAAGERSLEQEAADKPYEERKKRQERNDAEISKAAQGAGAGYEALEKLKESDSDETAKKRVVQQLQDELARLKKVRQSIPQENANLYNMANDYSFRSSDFNSPEDQKLAEKLDDYIKIAEKRIKDLQR
jgi:hypothetical protein